MPRDALDGAKAALGGTSSAARRVHRIDGIALGMLHESCQESCTSYEQSIKEECCRNCKMPAAISCVLCERGFAALEVKVPYLGTGTIPLKIDKADVSNEAAASESARGSQWLLPRNTRTHGRRRRQEGRDRSAALQPHALRGAGAARGAAADVRERFGGLAGFPRCRRSRI